MGLIDMGEGGLHCSMDVLFTEGVVGVSIVGKCGGEFGGCD